MCDPLALAFPKRHRAAERGAIHVIYGLDRAPDRCRAHAVFARSSLRTEAQSRMNARARRCVKARAQGLQARLSVRTQLA